MTEPVAELVQRAVAAGREAYRASYEQMGDIGPSGMAWVCLPKDEAYRPLVEELGRCGLGEVVKHRWRVSDDVFANPERLQNKVPQDAACKAFAAVLKEAGFHPYIEGWID